MNLIAYFNAGGKGVKEELTKLRDIDKSMEEKLGAAIKQFKSGWKG
jgi:hypothetical protein